MAKDADDKQKPEAKAVAAPVDDGLVAVKKNGETLRVHPSCVKDHIKVGWKQ